MGFLLSNFNGMEGYYSFSRTLPATEAACQNGLQVLYYLGDCCFIYPEGKMFATKENERRELEQLQDQDVLSVSERGFVYAEYRASSTDNAIVITLACNSNCIMCPVSEQARDGNEVASIEGLLEYVRYLPENIPYITITGGEPFLLGENIFTLLSALKEKFCHTQFQILTNGRAFADMNYLRKYVATSPEDMTAGIPIHGYNAATHDYITQAPGSFEQTLLGIQHLLSEKERVDIRFVICKLNEDFITKMAELVIREIPDVSSVKFMGLEMLGNAAYYKNKVWIDYEEAFRKSEAAVNLLLSHGIDVELYNFPLCTVPKNYWGLYRKSISDYKIRYLKDCNSCIEKDSCGGLFAGTMRLVKEVHPFT